MGEVYVEEFMSPGCVGCPAVRKMLEELSKEFEDQLTVEEVDITADTARASQYGIMSVPAVAINGILKFIDVPKKEELRNAILEELEREE
ncbi:MAG: thioredoxin family protein [Acidobacteriota bacterium]